MARTLLKLGLAAALVGGGVTLDEDGTRVDDHIRYLTAEGYKAVCWERHGLLFALVGKGGLEALVDGAYQP